MNWKTRMNLDLIEAQTIGKSEHQRTVCTLESLIGNAHKSGDTEKEAFWRRCLGTYEKAGYDL